MPLDLHPECKTNLIRKLRPILDVMTVTATRTLNTDRAVLLQLMELDKCIGKKLELLEQWVDTENPVMLFIVTRINQLLRGHSNNPVQPRLKDVLSDSYNALPEKLVADISSLPWKYTCIADVALSKNSVPSLPFSLGDTMSLVEHTPQLERLYLGEARIPGTIIPEKRHCWSPEALYLMWDLDGYISGWGGPTEEAAISTLRTFYGLCLSLGIIVSTQHHYPLVRQRTVSLFDATHTPGEVSTLARLPTEINWTVEGLEEAQKISSTKWNTLVHALTHGDKLLMLSAQWFFDSHVGSNELLSFFQATTALEILLGEGSDAAEIGLTELLANRCAYLLGYNRETRNTIIENFKRIYKVRSKIAHEGHNKLKTHDRVALREVRTLAAKVINSAIDSLSAERRLALDEILSELFETCDKPGEQAQET